MLKITVVSPAQGKNYYTKDDNYYLQEEMQSEWFGQGAVDLELSGSVDTETFQALLEGNAPNGRSLHAKKIDLDKHRAAYDCTFSAPKSFSIAAFRDPRLLELQQSAVKVALSVAEERYAQDREWNSQAKQQEAITTGNLLIALFPHDTSRSLDPQIHTHALVFNATKDASGNYRALLADGIFANRELLDQIYLNQLAHGAQELGYEIEPTQHGFELKGYSQELLDCFSKRRKEIESHVAEQIENGAQLAGRLYEQAALSTRGRKRHVSRERLVEGWEIESQSQGLTLPDIPDQNRDLTDSSEKQATTAAIAGIRHAEERESVFRRSKVERFALQNHLGQQSWNQLQTAIDHTNLLVRVEVNTDKYTTQPAIQRERETIQFMEAGKNSVSAIASIDDVATICPISLTQEQRTALEISATTTDRIMAWQGSAGVGKTYALNLFNQLATEKGYLVRGFAPSAESAKVLSDEAQIQSNTVASLIHSKTGVRSQQPELWIIDEAGMLSAKDAHALLKRASEQQARVILVGDRKQLSAVEAGNPFKLLQLNGMTTVKLEESLRQKTERLKLAVSAISQGDIGSSFHHLYQANAIQGVQDQEERQQRIVNDYLKLSPRQRERTLLIANTNAERLAIVRGIRAGLQAEGSLTDDTFSLNSLKPKDWTTSQAKYAKHYALGDVIVPTQDYRKQNLSKGEQYEVVGIERELNRLVLQSAKGTRSTINPADCERKTVYEVQQVPLAAGDLLRWTRNDRSRNRRNGQQFVVDAIDESGQAIAQYADGTSEFIELSGRQFTDYAIVNTTYSSQGKSADRVLVALDKSTGTESFYVAASRARHELSIYTTDEAELRRLAERSRAKENASDYLDLFVYEKNHAQNQTQPAQTDDRGIIRTSTSHSEDRGVSVGVGAGCRLAATLSRDRRDQASTDTLERSLESFDRTDWGAGIEADAIADTIANFIEQRAIVENRSGLANAFESIAFHLRKLERICREFAERDRESDQRVDPPQLTPEQEQQRQWAEAMVPSALDLMRKQSEVEEWRHQISPTRTQIYSPHYIGEWDREFQELTYTRSRDGQKLFTARREGDNDWALVGQPENITQVDVEYHRAIDSQRQRQIQRSLPTREINKGIDQER